MGVSIGLVSIKGGVGKTTLASALATDLALHHNKKVAVVDANYSAPNLGFHFGIIEPKGTIHDVLERKAKIEDVVHHKYGVDVIPGNYFHNKPLNYLKLKEKVKRLKQKYDFVVIDSSPSMNEEVLSAILSSDHLFVVTTPDIQTLVSSLKAARLARDRGMNIAGVILNKLRGNHFELSLDNIEYVSGLPVMARIKDDKHAYNAALQHMPAPIYAPNSHLAREINRLTHAMLGKQSPRPFVRRFFLLPMKKEELNREMLKESFYERRYS
ncbi:hypothetical protein D6817_02275 [Candidatus Pacearchaeota archaeon]|nr:MAG: hypothetical protein D6817_02275 [Candidatus Pacearchaeota archaeon]